MVNRVTEQNTTETVQWRHRRITEATPSKLRIISNLPARKKERNKQKEKKTREKDKIKRTTLKRAGAYLF